MPVDWGRLRRDAHHQCDLVTRAQCLAAGLSDAAQQWRVTSGRWVRVHDGVFLTRPGRQGWAVTATAELVRALSPGPSADAALCGRSALHLWGWNAGHHRWCSWSCPTAGPCGAATG